MQRFNEWLKDKKNMPIVVALAAVVFIAAGGLIAFEMGLFTPSNPNIVAMVGPAAPGTAAPVPAGPAAARPVASAPVMGAPVGMGTPMGMPPGGMGMGAVPGSNPKIAVKPAAPPVLNPASGPDPFSIPGGQKTLKERMMASAGKSGKASIRDILPAFNLFKIPLPTPPPAPKPFPVGADNGQPPPGLHVIGIVNAEDGIYAILDVSGQSQTVKPGDSLQDGSKVNSIQSTSVTFSSAGGATFTVPLTGGSDQTDQPQNNNPDNNGGNPGFTL